MLRGSHKKIRNCGGEYPESTWANKGYQIGPITMFECPKTFIKKSSVNLLSALDTMDAMGLTVAETADQIPNIYIEFQKILKRERADIQNAIAKKSEGQGE